MRVVPNKVFQGAAAGCAVVTSDTPAQRDLLGGAAVYVPVDDPGALAGALAMLADDRTVLATKRRAAADRAISDFTPGAVVSGLAERLVCAHDERMSDTAALPPLAPNAALRWHVVQQRLDEIRPESVLELGTGQGSAGARLAAQARYVGVEPDSESRAMARGRLPDEARLLEDLSDLDEGETFDLACAFEVLEHIKDDRDALAAWVQHVRAGGHVLVSVPADPDRFAPGDELAGHFRRYSDESLADLIESAGLEVVRIERYGYPLGSALETGRNLVAKRRLAQQTSPDDLAERTAGSGRHLQPPGWSGRAIWLATWPFRTVQGRFPDRGRGFLALARRPG
jgi:SAM-dependent methyltransferase